MAIPGNAATAAAAAVASPIEQPSQALFKAVAQNDCHSLAKLYADTARRTIVSFLSMRNRWSPFVGVEKSEEKCNEFLQQIACQESKLGYNTEQQSPPMKSRCVDDISYHLILKELEFFLTEEENFARHHHRQQQRGGVCNVDYLKDDHIGNGIAGTAEECEQPLKKIRQQQSEHLVAATSSFSSCTGLVDSNDVDRLLWESATIYSDSRPPSNFVVYSSDTKITSSNGDDSNDDVGDADANAAASGGPPIFDGSVANSTPPPLGGPATGPSGGAGTIVHLACARDNPLALALLLAMGTDARGCHTAFRRLMIHEAACNGSIQCLTLLLELGQACAKGEDFPHPPGIRRTPKEIQFLAWRREQIQRQEHLAKIEAHRIPGFFVPPTLHHQQHHIRDSPKGEFLQFLSLFRDYCVLVGNDSISELDAARAVLANSTLSHASRSSLARSCTFQRAAADSSSDLSAARSILQSQHGGAGGCADGHGNTPLHWAAFKNETKCVSLLLRYNADSNARAHPSGWTPLHDAAYSNSSESIALLIEVGANVDARANSGATPLCFAAQEDAADAAQLLLDKGADLATRCAGGRMGENNINHEGVFAGGGNHHHHPHSRFSGYSPLHYCAHYNAHRAAKVLLRYPSAGRAMEIPDLSERLAIHVAVARGSSDVLRELLHAGARIETPRSAASRALTSTAGSRLGSLQQQHQPSTLQSVAAAAVGAEGRGFLVPGTPVRNRPASPEEQPATPTGFGRRMMGSHHQALFAGLGMGTAAAVLANNNNTNGNNNIGTDISEVQSTTPVSSPVLRAMIPSQPISSSKPWNCLTQRSIDECKDLISHAERNWAPYRHNLFTPADRRAVLELLRVGKRLEQHGTGIFIDLWPLVLSFCGRGWFEVKGEDSKQQPSAIMDSPSDSQDQLMLPVLDR